MAITFPRLMPRVGVMGQMFEPQEVGYLSPEQSGRLGAVRSGFPIWTMGLDLNNMLAPDADVWRAWLAMQRGPGRRFYGFEVGREIPLAHQNGSPFTAAPSSFLQTIDSDATAYLKLGGLLAGMKISVGDYVGFNWSGWKRSLVRATEAATAGDDGFATFAIEPPVHTITPNTATVTLDHPNCLMRIDSANTKLARQLIGYTASGGSIMAAQDMVA